MRAFEFHEADGESGNAPVGNAGPSFGAKLPRRRIHGKDIGDRHERLAQ